MTYLVAAVEPTYADALDDIFHDAIQGLCGITDGSLIRPRWQPEPPNQPDFATNWVAFGIQSMDGDRNAYVWHDPAGNAGVGSDHMERDETLKLLCSFYGPGCSTMLNQFRDGLQIEQNRWALASFDIKLTEVQEAFTLPALLKEKWVKRMDINVIFKRRIRRVYQVNTVISDTLILNNEKYLTTIIINP